jgi:hypothetical protein
MLQSRRLYQAIGVVGASLCLTVSLILLFPRLLFWNVLPDFTIFWTAGRIALQDAQQVYDIAALTGEQSWAVSPSRGPRPFPYPPTTLLLFIPFGLIPFWAAYWSWLLLGLVAFWSAARRVATGWAVPLSLATPHVTLALILGQLTLIVGAMVIWCVTLLRDRPVAAGIILGLAAAIKPHSVLLAPVALVSGGGHRKALAVAAVTLVAVCLASLTLGVEAWRAWLFALQAFPSTMEWHALYRLGATPSMAGQSLGLDPRIVSVLYAASIAAGAGAVWMAFKTDDLTVRLLTLVIGSLFASPYGMRYDLAMIAPVLTMGLLSGRLRGLLVSVPLFALYSVTILPALLVSLSAELSRRRRPQPLIGRLA